MSTPSKPDTPLLSSSGTRPYGLLLLAFALTRLWELRGLPLFLDEALHIVWSGRLLEPGRFVRHLADGKSLQVWLLWATLPFASDPAWAARLLSVLVGGLGLWACHDVGQRLYGRGAGLAAGFLYVACPFAFFYDRMALADVYVSSFAALSLAAALRLAERPSVPRGLGLALILAACVLSKMTGVAAAATPVLAAALLAPRAPRVWRSLAATYGLWAALVGYPVYYFARRAKVWVHLAGMLVPVTHGTSSAAQGAARGGHLRVILENLREAGEWLWSWWTAPLALLCLAAVALVLWRRERAGLLLVACALGPIATVALVSGHVYPRYLVASVVPTAILGGRLLAGLAAPLGSPTRVGLLAAALALPALRFEYLLLADPPRAPLPPVEREQYLDGWQSGYGTADAAAFLRAELAKAPEGIDLLLHRFSERSVHLILRAYLANARGLEWSELDLADAERLVAARRQARRRPGFIALAGPGGGEEERFPNRETLIAVGERVLVGTKPRGEVVVEIYRLAPAP